VSYFTSDGQPASLSWNKAPIWGFRPDFLLMSDNCGFVDMGRPLWRENGSVVYNCCSLRQRSHSQVRVPRGSWPHFTISDLRLLQPGGPGPCIYIPQEQGGPVIPPGTGFHLHYSAGLGFLLYEYSLGMEQNNVAIVVAQQYLDCCLLFAAAGTL
jgi:hypothetical protein